MLLIWYFESSITIKTYIYVDHSSLKMYLSWFLKGTVSTLFASLFFIISNLKMYSFHHVAEDEIRAFSIVIDKLLNVTIGNYIKQIWMCSNSTNTKKAYAYIFWFSHWPAISLVYSNNNALSFDACVTVSVKSVDVFVFAGVDVLDVLFCI